MFEKYPRANQLIEELNYHEHLQKTHWIRIGREEAAISLAKAVLTQRSYKLLIILQLYYRYYSIKK